MKKIIRSVQRGSKLLEDCKKAKTSTNECGPNDGRVFCHGLIDNSTEEALEECKKCGAWVMNI